jgi:signal peptidase I
MVDMEKNQKTFNTYVFLSTFARALIETFIPLLLFKFGYSLKEVILYFLLYNFIELVISYPLVKLATKKGNKILAILGLIAFVVLQILLNYMEYSILYLLFISFLYAFYRTGYWLSRRYFNLKVIHKKDISSDYSIVTIVNQVALVFAGYIGSLFLDFIGTEVLTIIAMLLYAVSIIPLYLFKFEHDNTNTDVKIELVKTIKEIPFSNIYLFGSYEILNVLKFFFTLYLFIYVKDTYQTVGLFNLLTNLSIVIFAFYYGKKTNGKKNYLKLFIQLILSSLVYLVASSCDKFEGINTSADVKNMIVLEYAKYIMYGTYVLTLIAIIIFVIKIGKKEFPKIKINLEKLYSVIDWIILFPLCISIATFCFTFLFTFTNVSGDSMNPNIHESDRLLVTYPSEYNRFDVVVVKVDTSYLNVRDNDLYLKRIIGLPGEYIDYRFENGITQLYVNGKKVSENLVSFRKNKKIRGKGLTNSLFWCIISWYPDSGMCILAGDCYAQIFY